MSASSDNKPALDELAKAFDVLTDSIASGTAFPRNRVTRVRALIARLQQECVATAPARRTITAANIDAERAAAAATNKAPVAISHCGLPVCSRCGWHNGYSHAAECSPAKGAAANKLAAALPGVPSTKFGYGFGRLTFNIDENKSITLAIHTDGTYSVERIWWIGSFELPAIRSLVDALFVQRVWPEAPEGDDE